jgi:hypothetical protein
MNLKKRNGKWSTAKITTWAICVSSVIVACQQAWPYAVKAIRPWAETPDKVDSLNVKVDMIMERLGMNSQPKPPVNPYLPPKLIGDAKTENMPLASRGGIEPKQN